MQTTIERREVEALLNPAKTMLLGNARVGNALNVHCAQAAIKALNSVLNGTGKKYADVQDSKGGYMLAAAFKGAWAPLPVGIEHFTLAQVQEFLVGHGVELATDPVTDSNVDGVNKLENSAVAIVNTHDEHHAARADSNYGSGVHVVTPVNSDHPIVVQVPA